MNAFVTSVTRTQPSYNSSAFHAPLSVDGLKQGAPAVFAESAHERTSASYAFISTARVLAALESAGFLPVEARQAPRARSPLHARHLIRLRRRVEHIRLRDSFPELLLGNSHDGTCAYTLRAGLFRVVCTNGLVVSMGVFPVWRVTHRGDVVRDIVAAAVRISERFDCLAGAVERMERTVLDSEQRLEFAREALAVRFPEVEPGAIDPSQVLLPERSEDVGNDLWRVFNTIQSRILRGGVTRRLPTNRLTRSRGIRSIREDLRLNAALWEMAMAWAA
jgi:hypothetical protein